MHYYQNSASWLRYREILRREVGLTLSIEPREERMLVRGHDLHVDVWTPDQEPLGTIILVHGGGGHGRVLAPFADALVRRGWRVLSPDLPGYGLTRSPKEAKVDYAEWPAIIADLADSQSGPCGLAGFSVGGMTAVFAAELATRRLPVVATTLLDMADPTLFAKAARWQFVGNLSLLGFRLLPWLVDRVALPLALAAPMGKMSANPALNAYFRTDRLLGRRWVSARFFRTLHLYKPIQPAFAFPVLLAHPGEDAWTPAAWSTEWLTSSSIAESEVVVTHTGSHLPVEEESFTTIMESAHDFLTRQLASQDGGKGPR
jgi:alpha-beta hydrolase superfamily lysophospholipase